MGVSRGVRVLVVGSGAREHALAWAVARSPRCDAVFVAPGNGGTATLGTNLDVPADDPVGIVAVARRYHVDLVVLGPDAAVAAGVGDACREAGIAVFGPTAAAGRVESSKEYAKQLMATAGIPTAAWVAGGRFDRRVLDEFVAAHRGRCAVKADGLALGKGVTVCRSLDEAAAALDACLVDGRFGAAGERVVVEELLEGREVSVLALCDGERVRVLPPACDYKRAFDGDRGPNTGGMGAYAPAAGLAGEALCDQVVARVIQPCLDALRSQGTPFCGCLYAGLMLTADGVRVLEFNARFGDPETQVVLPLVAEDVLDLLRAAAHGRLTPGRVTTVSGACVGVVAASERYPEPSPTGHVVAGLEDLDADVLCFHAGTVRGDDGTVRTAGGRVLTIVARGDDLDGARRRAYDNLGRLHFAGMRYRSDIAAAAMALGVRP